MPHYYFHVADDVDFIDREGMSLPDAASAQVEAVRYAGALLQDAASTARVPSGFTMRVADASDATLFTLAIVTTGAAVDPG